MTVTLNHINQAAATIRGKVINTPCTHSQLLSQMTGAQVFLKFENLQFTAAFKERGALVKLTSLDSDQRRRGVIAMSAGNHAQGVAYHARALGIPAVIVMPRFTPNIKVEHTRAFGAEVILHGDSFDDAKTFAQGLAETRNLCLVHPYDDEQIIAGQGTIALEMLSCIPDLETLIVPIGGGGLISGIAIAAHGINPRLRVLGVQTSRFASMKQVLAGEDVVCGTSTIAEGIAVKQPGLLTREIVREHVEEILSVDEDHIEEAVLLLLEVEKTVVEGAGAAGLAALLKYREQFAGRKIGLVLSGGNIDLMILSSIIQRGLVRTGRMIRLRIALKDRPGSLAEITRLVSESDANILEVHHQRAFTNLDLQSVEVELVLQTRGLAHLAQIKAALESAGYQVRS
ncbi:MAG TPA: threonine ammonia-lyase [Blastocatellia bacterium]|nr:threonine ammonia-lyase [Blastocatellia bacterium]